MAPPQADRRPVLLLTALPYVGHVTPMRTIAASLVQSGYSVYMLTGAVFKENVEATGATFLPLPAAADIDDPQLAAARLGIQWKDNVLDQMAEYFEKGTIGTHMDPQVDGLHSAIDHIRAVAPGRKLVALTDVWFFGSVVIMAGAPGPRPDAWIGIGLVPIGLSSKDCAPWGPGELPDPSPEGRARDAAIHAHARAAFASTQARYEEVLARRGAQRVAWFWDEPYLLPDRFVQLSLRSLEWPRTDAPNTIRFSGGLPRVSTKPAAETDKPSWWGELASHRQRGRHIVAVSQGTIDVDLQQLVIPTMAALAGRDDILLVAALGKKDRTLPPGTPVPENTRVEGWIAYDDLLAEADLFITNGGYGSLQHAVIHGVPLIVAGGSVDKPEVAARVEWAGIGVNLRTATPDPAQIKAAVDKILADASYKQKAKQIQQERENIDPLFVIIQTIEEVV
ncbi:putative UDP-glucuronosyltransferase 2A3 [Macrophomina phaseolina]|uniref:UDP-glucuronosyltransferase 2A3 n=1 Tax=Macrophomina phaseolina TaxID=35725 RepID=A0ABQ8FRK4_9PEZI|nr:putative UDP-glucuronosyltransferase 2A3 [Macrophomina phaseolina]